MSMNKPHNLKSQNDEIKRMLGMTPPEEKPSTMKGSMMGTTTKKSFSTYSDASSVRSKPMRATSQIRTPVKPPKSVKNDDSDWEIEPLEMMPELLELNDVLENFTKKQKKAKD